LALHSKPIPKVFSIDQTVARRTANVDPSDGGHGGGWIRGNTIDGTQAELVRIPHPDMSLYHFLARGHGRWPATCELRGVDRIRDNDATSYSSNL